MKSKVGSMLRKNPGENILNPELMREKMGLISGVGDIVDFTSGHGVFSLFAAQFSTGTVHAIDRDPNLAEALSLKAVAAGVENIQVIMRDVVTHGSGLDDRSVDYAIVSDLSCVANPRILFREAFRVLKPAGRLAVICRREEVGGGRKQSRKKCDQPEQVLQWASENGFRLDSAGVLRLSPGLCGMVFWRKTGDRQGV